MIAPAQRLCISLARAALAAAILPFPAPAQDNSDEPVMPWQTPAQPENDAVPPPRTPRPRSSTPERPNMAPPGQPPAFVPPPPNVSRRGNDRTPPAEVPQGDPARLAAPGVDLNQQVGELVITDMQLPDVLSMVQNFTGKPVLQQAGVGAQPVTFNSQGPLTRGQAITVLESLLALNGVAIVPLGDDYLKAVPAISAGNNAPSLIEGSTLDMTPSQRVFSKIFTLDYLSSAEAVAAVTNFMSGLVGGSPVVAFDKSGTLLVTDSLINLQRIETLLQRVDKPAPLNAEMLFFQLRNVSSRDAQQRLERLQAGPLGQRLQGNTAFDADERTNQLIVYTHRSNAPIIRELISKLDMDVDPLTRTEMFSIRHADATEVADVIKEVVTGQERARDQQQRGQRTTNRPAQQNQPQPAAASEGAGVQFSPYLTIVPDERTNTIVATGTQTDLRLMADIISRLDALLPQVRIEVVITEVTLSENEASGLNEFGFQYSRMQDAPEDSLYPVGTSAGNGDQASRGLDGGSKDIFLSPVFQRGLSVTPFGLENFTIGTVFSIAETNSNVKVLSAPNVVTTHNREATILVGERRPLVTQTVTDRTTTTSNSDIVANVEYADIAIELKVKPLIGSNGVIQMEIEQKIEEVSGEVQLAGLGNQPVIGTRQASSFVSVANGKMVVLGGLQRVSDRKTNAKVFLLGDIPILGELFRPKTKDVSRTELLIFIRPVVINTTDEGHSDALQKINQIESRKEVERYMETGTFRPEPEPPAEEPKRVLQRGRWVEVQ